MQSVIGDLQAAAAVAIATTFDDNIYLTGFFSETDRRFRPAHVVVGELLSLTILVSLSCLISRLLATLIPVSVTGWLGFLPILIGLANLMELLRSRRPADSSERSARDPLHGDPLHGDPSSRGDARLQRGFQSRRLSLATILRDRQTYKVTAVGFSNGGNNLTIYIPLLANGSLATSFTTVLACYLAVITWLFLSFRLTRLPGLAVVLARYAKTVFPFVLMWLGFRILNDSGVLGYLI
jgi:cadmium resistance protein CadD (predicted permease)